MHDLRFTHHHILFFASLTTATLQTTFSAMTCSYPIAGPHEQQIYEFKRFRRNSRAARAPFRIVECQASRPLSRRFFGRKFLQRILTFSSYIARHANHKLRHQAQDSVLGCVDGSSYINSAAVQYLQSRFRQIKPHALREDINRWIIWLKSVSQIKYRRISV